MDFQGDVEVEAMEKSNDCVITIHEERGTCEVEPIEEGEIDVEQDVGLAEVLDTPIEKTACATKGFEDKDKPKASTNSSTAQCDILPSSGSDSSKNVGKAYRKRSEVMETKRKESEMTGHYRGDKSAKSFKSDENGHKERGFHLSDVFKGSESLAKGFQAADRLQSLKVPQAVVAFAQAAAKVNELPGWPLLPKPQMKKCEKCSREFYSMLNYRRHIRLHRRSLINDKDLRHERSQLAAYWDKLTPEEASDVISFKSMGIENLSGVSAFQALASYIQHPGTHPYPPAYMKAGTILLEIVQNKTSVFPLPSEKLLKSLDDASEGTFLCGGTSIAVQRFVYHNDAEKIGLEDKNVVASMSFLVEQKLLKAWIAEKGVEALRCEKALVEEEEAAQRKRAKELERKRQKKSKQKGRKGNDQTPNPDIDLGDEDANAPSAGDEEEYLHASLSFGVQRLEDTVNEVADENGFIVLSRDNQTTTLEIEEKAADSPHGENIASEEDQTQAETTSGNDMFVDQRIGRVIKDRRRTNFPSSTPFRTGDSSYQAYFRPRRVQHSARLEPYQQHYRKKLGGVYRGIVKGSNARVVWTRKASQPTKDDDQDVAASVGSVEADTTQTLLVGSLSVPLEGAHIRRPSTFSDENTLTSKSSTPESMEARQTSWAKPAPPQKVWKPVTKFGEHSAGENDRSVAEDAETDDTFPPKLSAVALRPAVDNDTADNTEPPLVDLSATSPSFSSKLLASFLSERWATAVERRNIDTNFPGKGNKNTKVWPVNGDQALDTDALSQKDPSTGVLEDLDRPRNFGATACGKALGRWHRNSKDKQGEQRYMPRQISMA